MIQLVYMSSATSWPTQTDLEGLLRDARSLNAERGITGLLLYKKGQFLQVLEGPDDAVRDLFETIRRDPRHAGVVMLLERQVSERSFGDWSMGFRNLEDQPTTEPGFVDVFEDGLDRERLFASGDRAVRLMRQFVDML